MKYCVIFVCHNDELANQCLKKYKDCFVMLVGNNPSKIRDSRCIKVNKLQDNIEQYNKLLTFTAWYAIVKNNLFPDYEYLCILEYDVFFDKYFFNRLRFALETKNDGVLSFLKLDREICDKFKYKNSENLLFDHDINFDLLKEFTKIKNINDFNYPDVWYHTSNQCIRRDILIEFIDWFYPDCLLFYEKDNSKCGYYHERLFSVFLDYKKIKPSIVKGFGHLYKKSHGQ